ncbi:MAG: AAA family ATPase [Novosphingobium sp.]|nr:AAA family ATPase [Novosphingobium sp.]
MIKLLKARLINFQKHSDLTVDFNDDVTIFTGLTDAGKSVIRRAIDWTIFCSGIKENDLRKEGTKQTSVVLSFNNGVEVEKVKSNSINRYILRKPNEDEQVFDNFGKDTPQAIKDAIGMSQIDIGSESLNLNISEQLVLPFLLDKTPSFRSKLFNKITGNELLDSLFKKCNKESLRISREYKDVEEVLVKQENDVVKFSEQYNHDKKILDSIKNKYAILKEKSKKLEELKRLSSLISENELALKQVEKRLSSIVMIDDQTISDLRKKAEKHSKLVEISKKLSEINSMLQKIESSKINIPEVDFQELYNKNELFIKLNKISTEMKNLQNQDSKNDKSIDESLKMLYNNQEELDEIWKKLDNVCPLCKMKKG